MTSTIAAGARPPRARRAPSPAVLWLPWRLALVAVLVGLAAVAWFVTDLRMAGMDEGPGTDPGAFGFYVTTWVVMMAAMMFPSVAPTVVMYVRLHRGRRAKGLSAPAGAVAAFLAGYLAAWAAAGVAGYGLLKAGRALDGGALAWDEAGRWVVVGVLVAAAAYQLTPLKDACLRRCRGPLSFFMESWREGRLGALRMGLGHGGWCVGCCWALMASLFALGAMSLAWMAVVAALIAVEKLLPWRAAATYGVTGVLVALAVTVAAAPEDVPGLTIPGEGMEMEMGAGMSG
jgi:predicted metal-binding membrane protein